jgi:hypothetical protein
MSPHTLLRVLAVALLAGTTVFTSVAQAAAGAAAAEADAGLLLQQAKQLTRSAVLYTLQAGHWPYALTHLSPSFVAAPLVAPSSMSLGATWRTVQPGYPAAWLRNAVPLEVCRRFNVHVRGDDGIYKAADGAAPQQCYGRGAPYTVLVRFADDDSVALHKALRRAGGWKHGANLKQGAWSTPPSRTPVAPPGHEDPRPIIRNDGRLTPTSQTTDSSVVFTFGLQGSSSWPI